MSKTSGFTIRKQVANPARPSKSDSDRHYYVSDDGDKGQLVLPDRDLLTETMVAPIIVAPLDNQKKLNRIQYMKTTNPKLDEAFNAITDCFTGADGGGEFIRLQCLIEDLEKRANSGDEAADKVLSVIYQMARLIKVANPS